MFELIALGIAGVTGVAGHITSKDFVRRRLRYTDLVDKPGIGLAAGVVTTIAAAPIVALLPVVGAGTAIAAGLGVGTGVSIGASQAKKGGYLEDEY